VETIIQKKIIALYFEVGCKENIDLINFFSHGRLKNNKAYMKKGKIYPRT